MSEQSASKCWCDREVLFTCKCGARRCLEHTMICSMLSCKCQQMMCGDCMNAHEDKVLAITEEEAQ